MTYGLLADITVLVHFFWILFLVTGTYWGRRNRTVKAVHGAGLLFAVISQIFGWYCPLTHLEVWLRARQDPGKAYPGSFIAHYAEKLVYIEVSQSAIFVLTVVLAGMTVLIYRKTGTGRDGVRR